MQSGGRSSLLATALRRRRVARAQELAEDLGISQATVSRMFAALGDRAIPIGRARNRRYALAHSVRGLPAALTLYRVDRGGRPGEAGTLRTIAPEGCFLEHHGALGWPLGDDSRNGLFPGLPYFIVDARPQGFLGRAFARGRGPVLGIPDDPTNWTDDDTLVAIVRTGDDLPGDLLLGETALEAFQRRRAAVVATIDAKARERDYPARAQAAIAGEPPGSSAGGEFPKFTAAIRADGKVRHCIVKFSPTENSDTARRWADLLVAEHHATRALSSLGIDAVATELVHGGGRVFLEITRFDRHGELGRSGVVTLASLEPALLGMGNPAWEAAAAGFARRGWLGAADVERVARLSAFGRLIADSDMHGGNVAFAPVEKGEGLALAPAYDMLPMLYAPTRQGEIPARQFDPPPPSPGFEAHWAAARDAASRYWQTLSSDPGVSDAFREISSRNAVLVAEAGRKYL